MKLAHLALSLATLLTCGLLICACTHQNGMSSSKQGLTAHASNTVPNISSEKLIGRCIKLVPGQWLELETQSPDTVPEIFFVSPDKDACLSWLARFGTRSSLSYSLRLKSGATAPHIEAGDFVEANLVTETINHFGHDPIDGMPLILTPDCKIYINELAKSSQKRFEDLVQRLVRYELGREECVVFSDGTVMHSFAPDHLVIGHMSKPILDSLINKLDQIDISKLMPGQRSAQGLIQYRGKSANFDPNDSAISDLALIFEAIRTQLAERAHRQLACDSVVPEPRYPVKNDYTEDFPDNLGVQLSDFRQNAKSGLELELTDEVYQKNKEFFDSLNTATRIGLWREGKQLYQRLKLEFGNCLPPIELRNLSTEAER